MTGLYAFNCAQREAAQQFGALHRQAQQSKFWKTLTGRSYTLLSLAEVQRENAVRGRHSRGVQLVALAQICGSEGRCADFDAAFRPLQDHTRARWTSVA